jgi:Host cell surface-exposed lipoprotein
VTTQAPAPSPAAPAYTVSQQQAIDAAESYLQDEPGFSYQGLIDQLDSSYGNGFSVADATFAVNHITVNWNQQAAIAAQNYMTSEPGWSCSGLVQQLDSPYGGQFTLAQAEYGAQSVGLGNC